MPVTLVSLKSDMKYFGFEATAVLRGRFVWRHCCCSSSCHTCSVSTLLSDAHCCMQSVVSSWRQRRTCIACVPGGLHASVTWCRLLKQQQETSNLRRKPYGTKISWNDVCISHRCTWSLKYVKSKSNSRNWPWRSMGLWDIKNLNIV
jgi:hypothetical protein